MFNNNPIVKSREIGSHCHYLFIFVIVVCIAYSVNKKYAKLNKIK